MAENQQQDQQQQGSSSNRGFAAMDEDKQREIASKGGSSIDPEDRSFSKDHELAAEAGQKGGQASQGDGGASATREGDDSDGSGRGGNFADDPERASEAGRKGGER
ncbi:KGG domain-containing protein [Brevundimonas sp. 3P9-tot-E]|uniref:general stress protein n=1 Tax=Brevundimonas TaxID=41275 RepID=UPI0034D6348C